MAEVHELHAMRTYYIHNPSKVIDLCKRLDGKGSIESLPLGEKLAVYEQLALAALCLGNDVLAEESIERLSHVFPEATRVLVLRGMLIETENVEKALAYYFQILEQRESNIVSFFKAHKVYTKACCYFISVAEQNQREHCPVDNYC